MTATRVRVAWLLVAVAAALAGASAVPSARTGPPAFFAPGFGPLVAGADGALIAVNGRAVQIDGAGHVRRPSTPAGFGQLADGGYGRVRGGFLLGAGDAGGVFSTVLGPGGAVSGSFEQPDSTPSTVSV